MAFASPLGIDLAGIGGALDQRRANALQQIVLQGQVDAQKADVAGRNALAAYFNGDQSQLGQAMAYKPEAVSAVAARNATIDKDRRERIAHEAPIFGRLFANVTDQPSYDQALAAAKTNGLDASKLPAQFDPTLVGRIVQTANAFNPEKFQVEKTDGGFTRIGDRGTVSPVAGVKPARNQTELDNLIAARDALPPGDPRRAMYDAAIEKQTTRPEDKTLVEVYDKDSPTGTRMVPRAEALNKPGAPKSGLKLTANKDGTVEFVQGAGAGMPDPNSTAKPVQGDIDKSLVDLTARSDRLGLIQSQFRPEYFQYQTQIKNWGTGQAEKLGMNVAPETKAALANFTQFRADASNELSQTLKAMSGAAITPQEAERLMKSLGDVDADSPTQFKAKLDSTVRYVALAKARLRHIKNNGAGDKGLAEIPLDNMTNIIKGRESALADQYRARGFRDNQLIDAVARDLRQEFGI